MMKFVGDRICASRLKLGFSVHELAERAGIEPIELGAVEAGLGRLPAVKLFAVASALNMRVGSLFDTHAPRRDAAPGAAAMDLGVQPTGEAARIARAYERIRDPSKRNMLLTLSELFADGSERSQRDVAH